MASVMLVLLGASSGSYADAAPTESVPRSAPQSGSLAPPDLESRGPTSLLRVVVFERGTRRPVIAAGVEVDGIPNGRTDKQGRFSVELEPGAHTIGIVSEAHQPFARQLSLPSSGGAESLGLDPIEELAITVRAPPRDGPAFRFTGEEARRIPGAPGDPFRVIELLPGVAPILWPVSVCAIRGSNPGATGYFIDGLRVPALFHFALRPSVVHPYLIDGIDFYPGV